MIPELGIMAKTEKRQISLENPVTGHQVIFLQTGVETGVETSGELLQIEYVVPSREEPLQSIPLHFHHVAEERFETLSGRLGVITGDKTRKRILEAGASIVIPPAKNCVSSPISGRRNGDLLGNRLWPGGQGTG